MKRHFDEKFKNWARSPKRKPLVIQGARQVGKTYFVENLTKPLASRVLKLDFIEDKEAQFIFESDFSKPEQLLSKIERHLNVKINRQEDILFFDEAQECPAALQALKYFATKMPELKIVAAGSFLGFATKEKSFPVGYVDFEALGPLSYEEFLQNFDNDLFSFFKDVDPLDTEPLDSYYHKKLLEYFRLYLALGGMPEVLRDFHDDFKNDFNAALARARKIQKNLIQGYHADFAKHAGTINASHILHVFDSIPTQLAQFQDESVGKYKFGNVIPNSSGLTKISGPLSWLEKANLVIKTYPCAQAKEPLKAYTKHNIFKLYYLDVGLLQASLNVPIEKIIDQDLGSYKGYIAENFVATELFLKSFEPLIAWAEGQAEVEFLTHLGKDIVPIEVKSSANFLRAKSLDSFMQRYQPKKAIKLAPLNRGYNRDKKIHTVPIYLAGSIFK